MYTREVFVAAAAAFYASGSVLSGQQDGVYENEYNWRAYMDDLSGSAELVSGFNASCQSTYDAFSAPLSADARRGEAPDFGHSKDTCWPVAPSSLLHPASSLTSLLFLFAPLLWSIQWFVQSRSSKSAVPFPTFLSVCSALLAAGSYRHHSVGDASGRALDHAAVSIVGVGIAVHLTLKASRNDTFENISTLLVRCVAFCTFVATLASGNIGDNAHASSIAAMVWGIGLSIVWPAIFINVAMPIGIGHYVANEAESFMSRAECTNSAGDAHAYDTLHSLWHVCAFISVAEAVLCPLHETSILDVRADNIGDGVRRIAATISPVSASTLAILVGAAAFPDRANVTAGVFFGLCLSMLLAARLVSSDVPKQYTARRYAKPNMFL